LIKLKRINGLDIAINCDQIKSIENIPETKITFINSDMLLVKDTMDEVMKLFEEYKKRERGVILK